MGGSLEAIAWRCFKAEEAKRREAARKRKGTDEDLQEFYGCALPVLRFAGLWLVSGLLLGSGIAGFLTAGITLTLLRFVPSHLRASRRLKAFQAGESGVVLDVYRFAVHEFRGQVERHRARTLGSGSEWGAARAELAGAVDDAHRSMAYWRARLSQDPDNRTFAGQLKTATGLHAKLRSALGKLDGRADVLRRFYNDCEAKIAVMDRCNRDIEETRRLDRLSGAASMVIAGAETALAGIGASFVREAQQVGEVLGSFERLQLKSLAGEAPLDDIEFLADRINESSEAEFVTVERLSRTMGEFGDIGILRDKVRVRGDVTTTGVRWNADGES